MAKAKRKDKSRVVLRVGEQQRKDGSYSYSWMDRDKKGEDMYMRGILKTLE